VFDDKNKIHSVGSGHCHFSKIGQANAETDWLFFITLLWVLPTQTVPIFPQPTLVETQLWPKVNVRGSRNRSQKDFRISVEDLYKSHPVVFAYL
jgi:hypothetical protein